MIQNFDQVRQKVWFELRTQGSYLKTMEFDRFLMSLEVQYGVERGQLSEIQRAWIQEIFEAERARLKEAT
jgi:hypothetical protein